MGMYLAFKCCFFPLQYLLCYELIFPSAGWNAACEKYEPKKWRKNVCCEKFVSATWIENFTDRRAFWSYLGRVYKFMHNILDLFIDYLLIGNAAFGQIELWCFFSLHLMRSIPNIGVPDASIVQEENTPR